MKTTLLFALLLSYASPTFSDCGAPAPPAPSSVSSAPRPGVLELEHDPKDESRPEYSWHWHPDDADPAYLYLALRGKFIGAYHRRGEYQETYRDFAERGGWGGPRALPFPLPKKFIPRDGKPPVPTTDGVAKPAPPTPQEVGKGKPGVTKNFGVEADKIHGGSTPGNSLNGAPVTREEVLRAIKDASGGTLPDDSAKPRLTIIGGKQQRERVLADLQSSPALKLLADYYAIQDYAPEEWAVTTGGFVCPADPTIYVQAPDGKVLHRQDGYSGPADLERALRRADPNYDPRKDPDLRKSADGSTSSGLQDLLGKVPPVAWALAAVGALLFLTSRNDSK